MLTSFNILGIEHIISMLIPILIGTVFIILSKKYPSKKRIISIILAITIILIRSVRYGFDIYLGEFKLLDLLSLHVCHIDLILLVICLIKPNRGLFTFNFLIGIPTALAVSLMPGQVHPEPGMLRAVFFIMSHTMLVMGAIYLLMTYKFKIEKKDIIIYSVISLLGIIAIYIFNVLTDSNYMYLKEGPTGTVLEGLYNLLGSFWYIVSIYGLLIGLLIILYMIYALIMKIVKRKTI